MARIGMRHLVFAPISQENSGAEPTYGTGLVIGRAVRGAITEERYDAKLYGDDGIAEEHNGIRALSVEVESTELEHDNAAALGLEKKVVSGTGSSATTTYYTTEQPSVYGGMGWVATNIVGGSIYYEAKWIFKIRLSRNGANEDKTKAENLEYGTHALSGSGVGLVVDDSGELSYSKARVFDSLSDALDWLDGQANITP